MAYNYLGLTNEVNRRLNEVELTSSNFTNATGFYAHIKDAVNASIRDINHTHYEWPFNHVLAEETLTAGTTRYAFPTDASTIDFDTFRIKEDATLANETVRLTVLTYDDYLQRYVNQEYSTDSSKSVVPAPDQAYEIAYEYYRIPVDLVSATDVPSIPERFKQVILDGAMYHAYMFRSNEQAATLAKTKFDEGIKKMRILLINRYVYMQSTAITQSSAFGGFGDRVR
jgi:hypothetical protein